MTRGRPADTRTITAERSGYRRTAEVARAVGVAHSTIYRLIQRERVRGFRIGRAWFVHVGDVEDYYQPRTAGGEPCG